MPLTPPTSPSGAEPPLRGRGDACPGALRLHAADDGALARVRLPAGLLTSGQAEVLARAAEELGDGHLDITSRGNVQLRGLAGDCGGALADRLRAAGLLPSDRHERARNIVASPLAGLDGAGYGDLRAWARELDRLLCTESDTTELSGRFLFALDDGRGDMAALGADVTLIAAADDTAVLRVGSSDGALVVRGADAPGAAVLAALEFLAAVRESGTRAWRVRELPARHAVSADRLIRRLAAAGIDAEPVEGAADDESAAGNFPAGGAASAGTDGESVTCGSAAETGSEKVSGLAAAGPPPGLVVGPDGRCALSVLAPLGRLTVAQWRLLVQAAARDGADQLRVTPWRGVVVPGLPAGSGRAILAAWAKAGLVVDVSSPWRGVGACTGRPGCAKSLTDVRADAARAVRGAPPGALPVYWSGCERRCGHPASGGWVDVLATGDGYRVSVRGAPETARTAHAVTTAHTGQAVTTAHSRQAVTTVHTAHAVTAEEAADAVAAARGTT